METPDSDRYSDRHSRHGSDRVPWRDPLTGVPPSKHPFQIWLLVACLLSGVAVITNFGRPETLQQLVPHVMLLAWAWCLALGGSLGVIAAFWRDRITGLLLERIALGAIGSACLVYGGVVAYVAGANAIITAILCVSIGVAAGWRIQHVTRELRTLKHWIERHYE